MLKKYIIYIISFIFTFSSYAAIQINKDRFFYKEQDKEILFDIKNKSEKESYIIQSWVSHYDKEDNSEAPFIISPSLIKLAPNENFTLKIIKTDDIKETNKESVYRVNIKLVPVIDDDMADKNLILISLNSIYNLFYTPKSIINKNHNKDINFSINNENLIKINNPTPYFITIAEAKIDDIDILNKRITLSPFKNYSIKDKKITKNIKDKKVHWKRVDEYEQTIIETPKEIVYE
ncbi:TPA: molecular chaperone [Proteus mirabilis]|uniref:fimbrial biogenesis chaperone n=1 Tax=Proteus mirabilis TaxID=584 RepID=UPI00073BC95D|nr:molecular chaperone [Proteus mirabilis]NAC32696.1 fimbria/pilus periplasmic chaperone [Escherichia coli]KSX93557.1 fimbrial chaperone protein [Proteus mirabilis]MBG2992281.1 molecular chaperone [Proteus mirabilis]MBG6040129.1 molecular chaperone [Proteus mirabilis]MBS3850790.1 molecular chaperone [Proteus mirabilis]